MLFYTMSALVEMSESDIDVLNFDVHVSELNSQQIFQKKKLFHNKAPNADTNRKSEVSPSTFGHLDWVNSVWEAWINARNTNMKPTKCRFFDEVRHLDAQEYSFRSHHKLKWLCK